MTQGLQVYSQDLLVYFHRTFLEFSLQNLILSGAPLERNLAMDSV